MGVVWVSRDTHRDTLMTPMGVTNDTHSDLRNDTQRHPSFNRTTPSDTHTGGVYVVPPRVSVSGEGLDFMIKVEPCKGCGRTLFTGKIANLDVRCEVEGLDAQEAVTALLAGRELWKAGPNGLTPATPVIIRSLNDPAPPTVVGTHVCKAVGGRLPASQRVGGPTPPKAPPGPPVGPSVASLGPSTGLSGVLVAVNHPSDPETDLPETARRPTCDACGLTCESRTYTGVMLGGTWIHVWHDDCT